MDMGSHYYYPYQLSASAGPPVYGAPGHIKMEPTMNPDFSGKRKIKTEFEEEENKDSITPHIKKVKQEKITDHLVVKKKRDRFNGMTEEEVMQRTLPDHLQPNLDIVIIGFNPGLTAAYVGHHYAGPGNHFWKCLHLSELIPEPMTAYDDSKLLKHGIGFTNIVHRTTRGSGDLTKQEIRDGGKQLHEKLKFYAPKIAVFNGKGIYEIYSGQKNFIFGKQPDKIDGTDVTIFVMPSSSARCSQLPRAIDKVPFYVALRKLRDYLVGKTKTLNEAEVCFPDLELKVKSDKTDKNKNQKSPKQENIPYVPPPQSNCLSIEYPRDNNYQSPPIQPQGSFVKPEPFYNPEDYGRMPVPQGFNTDKGAFSTTPSVSTVFHNLPYDTLSPPPPNQPIPVGMSQYTNYPQTPYGYLPFPT